MSRKKIIIIATTALLICASGFWWWKNKMAEAKPRVLASREIKTGEVRKVLEGTGIIKAQVGAIVKIGARATGEIKKMLVKVGDPVKKGDLIAVIDARENIAGQTGAAAKLQTAQDSYAQTRETYPLKVAEAEAQLKQSEAQAEYADLNFKRMKRLFKDGIVSRDEFDKARQEQKVKTSDVASKAATLDRLKAEQERQLKIGEESVRQARADLDTFRVRVSYSRIFSPLTGVVSQVTAQEGETVVAGLQVANLITVLDPARLEMWIYVDETDVGQARPGMPVEFRVDAYPDRVFKGVIKEIYPQPEIRDNIVYYQALVTLDAEQALSLRPEMTTHCQILVQVKSGVTALPNQALKWVDGEQVVFLVGDDGKVAKVKPELGLSGLTHSEVVSGVKPGDRVATQIILPKSGAAKSGGTAGGPGGGMGGPGGPGGQSGSGGQGAKKKGPGGGNQP